jgi:anion-transporting  ArsA/GET3 family ATPase
MDLNPWLDRTKLVVCVGAGGVGKTTTAAAIALRGALSGRRTMVLTIDPARRLANSLGLDQFGNREARIDLSGMEGVKPGGELWAMMLDARSTFDALIHRVAPSDEVRERILANHVYRHMADTFAGSQDYMASEKIYDVAALGTYDLLVLDTPPVKNALDFLESPGRLVNFLDERVLSWFLDGSRSSRGGMMFGTSKVVFYLLGRVFGEQFIDDLSQFFRDFEGLYEGFRKRHQEVLDMFRAPTTQFVTVCAPSESSVDVASFFLSEFERRALPCGGIIVNQVHACSGQTHDAESVLGATARSLGGDLPPAVAASVVARLGMAHRRLHTLAMADHALALGLKSRYSGRLPGFFQEVPRMEDEVHDLPSLREVGRALFDQDAAPLSS